MLYLIKLDSYYKIGYSQDTLSRIKQLSPTHVDVELISTKLGNKDDEKEIHKLCKPYHIKNELFLISKEVESIFNTYISIHFEKEVANCNKLLLKMLNITPDNELEEIKHENSLLRKICSNYEEMEILRQEQISLLKRGS